MKNENSRKSIIIQVIVFLVELSLIIYAIIIESSRGFDNISLLFGLFIPLMHIQVSNIINSNNRNDALKSMNQQILAIDNFIQNFDNTVKIIKYGASDEVAKTVADKLNNATSVRNTFVYDDSPYSNTTEDLVFSEFVKYINQKRGNWIDVFAFPQNERITRMIEAIHGGVLDISIIKKNYSFYHLKYKNKYVPIINFVIIHYKDRDPEVFFGWGFSGNSVEDSVFGSSDEGIVSYFSNYHESLIYSNSIQKGNIDDLLGDK